MSGDAQPAASSPAAAPPPVTPSDVLASASPEAVIEWRKTGDVATLRKSIEPSSDAPPADSSSAAPVTPAPDAVAVPSTAPKGETPSDPPVDKRSWDIRGPELLKERGQARAEATREKARADALQRQLDALSAPPRSDATPAAPSAAPADDDPEPNPEDAAKYPDGVYDRKFIKDQAAWEARSVHRAERAKEQERRTAAQRDAEEQRINQSWAERVESARAKLPDFDEKAFGPTEIVRDSLIDRWILESDLGAEVLYHLQTTPGEVRRIAALPVMKQLRELAVLETKLSTPPAVKTETDAPPPPRTLGNRPAPSGDPVERALAAKDVGAYIDAANKRDLASRRR